MGLHIPFPFSCQRELLHGAYYCILADLIAEKYKSGEREARKLPLAIAISSAHCGMRRNQFFFFLPLSALSILFHLFPKWLTGSRVFGGHIEQRMILSYIQRAAPVAPVGIVLYRAHLRLFETTYLLSYQCPPPPPPFLSYNWVERTRLVGL